MGTGTTSSTPVAARRPMTLSSASSSATMPDSSNNNRSGATHRDLRLDHAGGGDAPLDDGASPPHRSRWRNLVAARVKSELNACADQRCGPIRWRVPEAVEHEATDHWCHQREQPEAGASPASPRGSAATSVLCGDVLVLTLPSVAIEAIDYSWTPARSSATEIPRTTARTTRQPSCPPVDSMSSSSSGIVRWSNGGCPRTRSWLRLTSLAGGGWPRPPRAPRCVGLPVHPEASRSLAPQPLERSRWPGGPTTRRSSPPQHGETSQPTLRGPVVRPASFVGLRSAPQRSAAGSYGLESHASRSMCAATGSMVAVVALRLKCPTARDRPGLCGQQGVVLEEDLDERRAGARRLRSATGGSRPRRHARARAGARPRRRRCGPSRAGRP